MASPTLIAYIERRNELAAKRLSHSYAEIEAAHEVQYHIRKQAEIEEQLMAWDIEIDKMRTAERHQANLSAWSIKKVFGGLL